jgi:excisionase family DNA binding protein
MWGIAMTDYPQIGQLLKANEVASLLRISKAAAYRLMQSGELPSVRFGGSTVRVRAADLTRFVAEHIHSQAEDGK